MTRDQLIALAKERLSEAALLARSNFANGAYYLAGHAVVCALKACIAKRVNAQEFPDLATVRAAHVHDIDQLVDVAQLRVLLLDEQRRDGRFAVNWNVVRRWNQNSLYRSVDLSASQHARDMLAAITEPNHGVLQWLRRHW